MTLKIDNFKDFTDLAIRTEAIKDTVQVDAVLFKNLQEIIVNTGDILDLIKKNAFYGKTIDYARVDSRLSGVMDSMENIALSVPADNSNYKTITLDTREFHGALGFLTEAIELFELVDLDSPTLDLVDMCDELGDSDWYKAILLDAKTVSLEDQVWVPVILKLQERFPDAFESALAITRDKNAEKAITKSAVEGK